MSVTADMDSLDGGLVGSNQATGRSSPRGRTAYIAKREQRLVEQARLYYRRVQPRDVAQLDDELRNNKLKRITMTAEAVR